MNNRLFTAIFLLGALLFVNHHSNHDAVAASFDCTTVIDIYHFECDALVALYNNTNGDNWTNNSGWLSSTSVCTWWGIDCSGVNIAGIHLDNNNLSGIIPPMFGNLPELWWLDLSNNQLTAVSREIVNLSSLGRLNLAENQLASLPPEFGYLASLFWLDLSGNQLSALPPGFGNLSALSYLFLSENQLTTLPLAFGNLSTLGKLSLSNNQLTALPPEFGNLSSLWWLDRIRQPILNFAAGIWQLINAWATHYIG